MSHLIENSSLPETRAGRQRPPHRAGSCVVDLDGGASSRQAALLNLLQRANARPSFPVLLEDAARLAAQGLGAPLAVWGQVGSGDQCRLALARLDPPGGNSRETTGNVSTSGLALCAHVLQTGCVIAAERFGKGDPPPDPLLRHAGIVGGITVPFHVNARPAGLLGTYTTAPRKWHPDEVVFVETVTHLLVASSARLLAEEELEAERRARLDLLETVNAIVVTLDSQGRIVDLNQPGQRLTGYSLKEVRGAAFCSKLVPPGEVELTEGILRSCRSDSFASEYAGWLLRKDGSQLRVAWTVKVLHNGQMQSIVLVGIDRTDDFQTAGKLRRMTSIARNAMGAFYSAREEQAQWERLARPGEAGTGTGPEEAPSTRPPARPEDPTADPAGHAAENRPGPPGGAPRVSIKPPFEERRASPRHPYPYRQSVAPIVDGKIPSATKFFQVECRNISSVGVAFYYDQVPDFTELVLALGCPPQLTKLVCRVVRVAGVEYNGRKRYLVGCRFTGRCKR